MPTSDFLTLKQFAKKHPSFTEGALRMVIFHASRNGLARYKAIARIGAKVLLSESRFFKWIEDHAETERLAA